MFDLDAPPRLTLPEILCPSSTDTELLTVLDDERLLIAYLSLRRYVEGWLVCDVFTMWGQREQGRASGLLRQAIEVSQETDLDLVLQVASSEAPNTRTNPELLAWYHRYGFDTHPEFDEPAILRRRHDA